VYSTPRKLKRPSGARSIVRADPCAERAGREKPRVFEAPTGGGAPLSGLSGNTQFRIEQYSTLPLASKDSCPVL
jgi:hypothetical protein